VKQGEIEYKNNISILEKSPGFLSGKKDEITSMYIPIYIFVT